MECRPDQQQRRLAALIASRALVMVLSWSGRQADIL